MCAGSKLGCLRENCPYWCDWVSLVTQNQIKGIKMYYAWCIAKGDGTYYQANSEWMTDEDKKSYKAGKNALSKVIGKLLRESGFGAPGAPSRAPSNPTDPPVSRRTRSQAAATGGEVGKPLPTLLYPREQWEVLPNALPK